MNGGRDRCDTVVRVLSEGRTHMVFGKALLACLDELVDARHLEKGGERGPKNAAAGPEEAAPSALNRSGGAGQGGGTTSVAAAHCFSRAEELLCRVADGAEWEEALRALLCVVDAASAIANGAPAQLGSSVDDSDHESDAEAAAAAAGAAAPRPNEDGDEDEDVGRGKRESKGRKNSEGKGKRVGTDGGLATNRGGGGGGGNADAIHNPMLGSTPPTARATVQRRDRRNAHALAVLARVNDRLTGVVPAATSERSHSSRDGGVGDAKISVNVKQHASWVIQQATSSENLCLMYEGWAAWV